MNKLVRIFSNASPLIFGMALFFIVLYPATAQETDSEEPDIENEEEMIIDLGEVTVTGTSFKRTGEENSVQTVVITAEDIADSEAEDLDEVFEENGLEYTSNAMGSYISLQGLSGNRVLYLINGRPVTGTPTGKFFGSEIPLSRIERMEIVKGPQSALYGSDAMGGVINIITKQAGVSAGGSVSVKNYSYPMFDEVTSVFASLFQKQVINGSYDWSGEIMSHRAAASIERAWDFLNRNEQSIIPGRLQLSGSYDGSLPVGDSMLLDLGTSILSDNEKDIFDNEYDSYEVQNTLRSSNYAELTIEGESGEMLDIDVCYNFFDQSSYSNLLENRTAGSTFFEHYASVGLLCEAPIHDWFFISSGLSGKADFASKSNIDDGALKSRYTGALVLQGELRGGLDSALLAGVRGEYNNDFGFNFTPRISGSFYPLKRLKILTSCGFGYRAPTFLELYLDKAGNIYHKYGNPDLRPETSVGTSLGVEFQGEVFQVAFDAYLNDLSNEIAYDYTGEDDGTGLEIIIKENLEDTLRAGANINLTWDVLDNLAVNGRYSFLFSYDQKEEIILEDQPVHSAGGYLQYKESDFLRSRLSASWFSEYTYTNAQVYSARLILDWNINFNISDYGSLSAGINNILDQKDAFSDYDAGRNIFLSYTNKF